MSYFSSFPKIDYSLENDGNLMKIVDIFRIAAIDMNSITSNIHYSYYNIQDGERPDIVSHKLYGSSDYYWTFFLLNDSLYNGHCLWPMSQNQLTKRLDDKYSKYGSVIALPYIWYVPNNKLRNAPYLQIRNASGIPFDKKYLPYLKIRKGDESAKIHEYIHSMSQIVFENEGLSDSFYDSGEFYVFFDGDNALKKEWEDKMFSMMKTSLLGRETFNNVSDYYLFTNFCTPNFKNAPAYYYDSVTGNTMSAYDALVFSNLNGQIPEKNNFYKTIAEAAAEENDSRKKIKVIRKEYIQTFIQLWKSTINQNG